jgi:hypothetical protein
MGSCTLSAVRANQALDAEPPIASFPMSTLIGGGPVNATVRLTENSMADEPLNPYAATASTISPTSSKSRLRIILCAMLFFFGAIQVLIGVSFLQYLYYHRASNVHFYPLQGLGQLSLLLAGIIFLLLSYRLTKSKSFILLAVFSCILFAVGHLLLKFGIQGPTFAYSTVWQAIFGTWF